MREQLEEHQLAERDAFGLKPIIDNPTGIHPVEFKCLILLDPTEEVTKGGIIKPDMRQERDQMAETFATLIECGGNAFKDPVWEGLVPKPGNRILINKYSGEGLVAGDTTNRYRLCNDKDIVAVVKE